MKSENYYLVCQSTVHKDLENKFKRIDKHLIEEFPGVELITLPSPSPRYAKMTKEEKTKAYRELLPKMKR